MKEPLQTGYSGRACPAKRVVRSGEPAPLENAIAYHSQPYRTDKKRKLIHPIWGLLEIAGLFVCFQGLMWVVAIRLDYAQWALPALWMLIVAGLVYLPFFSPVILHGDTREERGWIWHGRCREAPGSWRNAWRAYAVFTLVAAIVLLVWAWQLDPARVLRANGKAIRIKFAVYAPYAFLQAVVFYGFILTRLRYAIPMSKAADTGWRHRLFVSLAVATCFACFHLPNKPLMALALPVGFGWAWIFYQRPNLLLLALSQATLGTLLHRVVQLHTRIGPFYDQPDLYVIRAIIPGLRRLIGDLF